VGLQGIFEKETWTAGGKIYTIISLEANYKSKPLDGSSADRQLAARVKGG